MPLTPAPSNTSDTGQAKTPAGTGQDRGSAVLAEPRSPDAAHECLRLHRVGGHRSRIAVDADQFAKRRRAQIQTGEQLRPVPTQVRLKAVEPGLVARLGNLQPVQSGIEFTPLLPRLFPDLTDPLQVQPPNQLGGVGIMQARHPVVDLRSVMHAFGTDPTVGCYQPGRWRAPRRAVLGSSAIRGH